jgi:hypothetical protein
MAVKTLSILLVLPAIFRPESSDVSLLGFCEPGFRRKDCQNDDQLPQNQGRMLKLTVMGEGRNPSLIKSFWTPAFAGVTEWRNKILLK